MPPECLWKEEPVRIVVTASSEYLHLAVVMAWSVMSNGTPEKEYVFYILHNDIALHRQLWFQQTFEPWDNCEVNFLDIRDLAAQIGCAGIDWTGKLPCFSLFAPYLLPQYDKAVLLDIDLIVRRDIADLYQVNLGNKLLGAVYDLDFIGQWMRKNKEYRRYYTKEIHLPDPMHYIQSGVLVVNLRGLREKYPVNFFFHIAAEKKFRYDDQDVYNLYCSEEILPLDYRWNVLHDNDGCRVRYVISFAPQDMVEEYKKARKNPYIIHYAGNQKPWRSRNCDYGAEYWEVASCTPVAEWLQEKRMNGGKDSWFLKLARIIYHEAIRIFDLIKLYL